MFNKKMEIKMNQVLLNKMSQMKLYGMHNAFQTILETGKNHSLTNDEFLNHLIQAEWEEREFRKINRYLRLARFRYQASIEDIDFNTNRNLDKNLLLRLADCSFIERKENILISGPTGVGKSFIASAIGNQACIKGFRTLYFNTRKLFSKLRMAKADGSYMKEIEKIGKHDLLILDDFGMEHLDKENRLMLLEIIEDRHGRKSTIISSQLPVSKWYEIIGDNTIADAILDRIIHTAHRTELKGESMRKLRKKHKSSNVKD
jgi:DNA replication protein DnaC